MPTTIATPLASLTRIEHPWNRFESYSLKECDRCHKYLPVAFFHAHFHSKGWGNKHQPVYQTSCRTCIAKPADMKAAQVLNARALFEPVVQRFKHKAVKRYTELRTEDVIGCTIEDFRVSIAKRYWKYMNQGNHGLSTHRNDKWHFDHERALWGWDFDDPVAYLACNHWRNLFPLWECVNIAKGASEDWTMSGWGVHIVLRNKAVYSTPSKVAVDDAGITREELFLAVH